MTGLEWEPQLRHRAGGATYLDGIDVYYDFNWVEICGHGRSQFKNGQSLARLARSNCPAGKSAALLLTCRDDVLERPIETDTHFFLVVHLPRYLEVATGNPAFTYYARRLESEIARLTDLQEVASRPEVVQAVLTIERVAAWILEDPERWAAIRTEMGADTPDPADIPGLLAALEALEALELDADSAAAIARFFGPGTDRERRHEILRAVTADPEGRWVAGAVLAERAPDRMVDARNALAEYQALLDNPDSVETDLQGFIEGHPWLLGLEYVRARPRRDVPRGTADFLLERYDGFHDLLELKSPQDDIIRAPEPEDGVQPSASNYKLSSALANALAQVHVYRDILTTDAGTVLRQYGLERTRDPRVIIVIGREPPPHRADVLRELNKSLHRVEIVPYDALAERGEAVLDNVAQYLLAAGTGQEGLAGA
ncbi:Shedu anti-phage system protein SduA domain-containing protein [Gaiella sp.]|uniref:Shedu anti-phage system protein SduA domain-containing protein n=1 Tax=Gaiella sp. TaxID=2663207 RepID=UPI002E2EB075|nr:Shedu anti-phage system protein SduA domain-containing protein [Gaiella sp.]HEX5583819.1 Shedu anti-phage system protein SduA domain-containing protein [Gaiella sp.]